MLRKVLLIAAVFAAGNTGFVRAQNTTPAAIEQVPVKKSAYMRIVYLKDRIKNQRDRIERGLTAGTVTADQAKTSRALLDSVENKMKDEHAADGLKKTMSKETYEAYNASLDDNSAIINEQKQYLYYYGPYADSGPNYDYYYDEYPAAGTPTPSIFGMEKTSPGIFKLKDRLKAQRVRIQRYLSTHSLSGDQARHCDSVLDSANQLMNADFKVNGSPQLTKSQSTGLNAMLDTNSTVIQESRIYFYYYNDHNYIQNYWN